MDAERRDAGAGPPDAWALDTGPPVDAGRSLVDPDRPYGYRTLHPVCGAWAYDLDDPSTYDTTGELAVAIADARCRWTLACHDATSSACDPFRVDTPAEALHAPVEVGAARACLDALGSAACDDESRYAAELSCAPLGRYGAPDGSPCSADRWCRSGHCEAASATCGGTCAPAPECAGGCGADAGCVAGACVPRPTEGMPCGGLAGLECASGLLCHPATYACVHAPIESEPCVIYSLFPGVESGACSPGLACDHRVCVAPTIGAPGDPCDATLHLCPSGSDCIDGSCAVRPAERALCRAADRACASGLGCNASRVCAPMVGPGCDCTDGSACPWSFRCVAGTCQRIGLARVACTDALDCDWGECLGGVCVVHALGTTCSLDGPGCSEGHCRPMVRGVCAPTVPSGGACDEDPYGCGRGEACVDFTTFCAVPADQQNPCAPGWP